MNQKQSLKTVLTTLISIILLFLVALPINSAFAQEEGRQQTVSTEQVAQPTTCEKNKETGNEDDSQGGKQIDVSRCGDCITFDGKKGFYFDGDCLPC